MKRALIGFVLGVVLGITSGYAIASLIDYFAWLEVDHLHFHLAFWCAMHGSCLGANVGLFGWRLELREFGDIVGMGNGSSSAEKS